MTQDRKVPPPEDQPEELTPEQIEQVVGGEGLGAGKVNVGDLAFPPHRDAPTGPRFTG
jgi:hypothetical protein